MATELKFDAFSSLCSLGPRPIVVTGFLRQWFIQHFSTANNIEHPELRSLLWTAMPDTPIDIESITRWKPSTTEKRPAIVIARNDWKVLRLGIDDRMMGYRSADGVEHYAAYYSGSHTLFCLSGKPMEAEILAAEVCREMIQFGPTVRKELDLMRFLVVGVGKLFEVEEARENFAVPVTVAYSLEDRWRIIPHAPFLKKIQLSSFLP